MNAIGGVEDTNQDTQVECRDECIRRGTSCAGFDFNRNNNGCFIHENEDNVVDSNRGSNSAVDLYIKKPCGMRTLACPIMQLWHIALCLLLPLLLFSHLPSLKISDFRKQNCLI